MNLLKPVLVFKYYFYRSELPINGKFYCENGTVDFLLEFPKHFRIDFQCFRWGAKSFMIGIIYELLISMFCMSSNSMFVCASEQLKEEIKNLAFVIFIRLIFFWRCHHCQWELFRAMEHITAFWWTCGSFLNKTLQLLDY